MKVLRDLCALFLTVASLLLVLPQTAGAQTITLKSITTKSGQPIGIDYHEPSVSVVVSTKPIATKLNNFDLIKADGSQEPFSNASGIVDEVKIGTIRSGGPGEFTTGDLFVGNGKDGEIVRITEDGAKVIDPWLSLPGENNGLFRGVHHDRTGVFDGKLILATTEGQVWCISSDGKTSKTPLASVGTHLKSCITVPNDPVRYGPLAGKIIGGSETQSLLYSIDVNGKVETHNLGILIEDIDLIPANQNFFGVHLGVGNILGAGPDEFKSMVGDILLTQENHVGSGLHRLHWDGKSLVTAQLDLGTGSAQPGLWKHVSFTPAGVTPINSIPVFVPPSPCGKVLLAGVNLPFSFTVTVKDADPLDTVTLTATGIPTGATLTNPLPAKGNPVSTTFKWVPKESDKGRYTLKFEAEDPAQAKETCTVVVEVVCGIVANWSTYGTGVPGTIGTPPALELSANPVLHEKVILGLVNSAGKPTYGMVTLGLVKTSIPSPWGGQFLTQPLMWIPTALTTTCGAIGFTVECGSGLDLCGQTFYFQLFILDSGAIHWVAISPGLQLQVGI